jgi:hypothetical protein
MAVLDPNKTKQDLIRDLTSCAEWRDRKAEEADDDGRNGRAAAALRQAAQDMAAVPGDDPRLLTLAMFFVTQDDEEDVNLYLAEESLMIGRYGFDDPECSADELLNSLVDLSERAKGTHL